MLSLVRSIRFAIVVALLAAVGVAQDSMGVARETATRSDPAATSRQTQEPVSTPGPEAAEPSQDSKQGETEEGPPPDQEEEPPLEALDVAKPFEWSWNSFLGLLTGRETFTAKDGKLTFRLGSAFQIDGTTGTEDSLLEQAYGSIDSSVDLRRLRLSGHGRVNDMNFMVSADLGVDAGLKDFWFEGRQG